MFSIFNRKSIFPISTSQIDDTNKAIILKKLLEREDDIQYAANKANAPIDKKHATLQLKLISFLYRKIERNETLTKEDISLMNGMFEKKKTMVIELADLEELKEIGTDNYELPGGKDNYYFIPDLGYVRLHEIK